MTLREEAEAEVAQNRAALRAAVLASDRPTAERIMRRLSDLEKFLKRLRS